jgi:hypothetical protein
MQGRLSGLERKTYELIAHQAGWHRKPVQHLVGAGAWGNEAVMAELRRHVAHELGDPDFTKPAILTWLSILGRSQTPVQCAA